MNDIQFSQNFGKSMGSASLCNAMKVEIFISFLLQVPPPYTQIKIDFIPRLHTQDPLTLRLSNGTTFDICFDSFSVSYNVTLSWPCSLSNRYLVMFIVFESSFGKHWPMWLQLKARQKLFIFIEIYINTYNVGLSWAYLHVQSRAEDPWPIFS